MSEKRETCKVQSAFNTWVNNVTKTAKRCYLDARHIDFKKPKCECKKCLNKLESK